MSIGDNISRKTLSSVVSQEHVQLLFDNSSNWDSALITIPIHVWMGKILQLFPYTFYFNGYPVNLDVLMPGTRYYYKV